MISAKRFLLTLLCGAGAVALLNVMLAAYTQPLVGDLTRIGALSERQFGWRAAQPAMTPATNTTPLRDADVVVVGDSFSRLGLWQGEVERLTGLRTHTLLMDDKHCPQPDWLSSLPIKPGGVLILESVERLLAQRLTNWASCRPQGDNSHRLHVSPISMPSRSLFDVDSDVGFKLKTVLHDALATTGKQTTFGRVRLSTLEARRFSSAEGTRLLYLTDDDDPENQIQGREDEAIRNLINVQQRLAARQVRLKFLLAPNKSSAYLETHRNRSGKFSAQLARSGLAGDDMLSKIVAASDLEADFYLPDDTHWGNRGYKTVARIAATWLTSDVAH